MFITVITLLNVLIAILGNVYNNY